MASSLEATKDRMSSVSKNPWKKLSLDEPQKLERSNEFEPCPHRCWETQSHLFFCFPPKSILFKNQTPYLHSFHFEYQKWVLTLNGNNETSDELKPTCVKILPDRPTFRE